MLHPNFLSSVTIDFILSDSLNLNSSAPEIVDSPSANVHANESIGISSINEGIDASSISIALSLLLLLVISPTCSPSFRVTLEISISPPIFFKISIK